MTKLSIFHLTFLYDYFLFFLLCSYVTPKKSIYLFESYSNGSFLYKKWSKNGGKIMR